MTAPALNVVIQGLGSVSADNLNTYVQWCSTTTQLRAVVGLNYMTVYLQGITTPNDGGQGTFIWLPTVTNTDDNLNYIIPSGANGGGWVRMKASAPLPKPAITGSLSLVTDANAKVVLTSIIAALTTLGLATNGTT